MCIFLQCSFEDVNLFSSNQHSLGWEWDSHKINLFKYKSISKKYCTNVHPWRYGKELIFFIWTWNHVMWIESSLKNSTRLAYNFFFIWPSEFKYKCLPCLLPQVKYHKSFLHWCMLYKTHLNLNNRWRNSKPKIISYFFDKVKNILALTV